jgi:hypothetical protein
MGIPLFSPVVPEFSQVSAQGELIAATISFGSGADQWWMRHKAALSPPYSA